MKFFIKYKIMNDISEKDKQIASLRQQLREANSKCSALEQENALLSYQLKKKESKVCLQSL